MSARSQCLPLVLWFESLRPFSSFQTGCFPQFPFLLYDFPLHLRSFLSFLACHSFRFLQKEFRLVSSMLSRTAGALRFQGEVRVHANFEGTAFPRSSVLPARVFTKSYSGLKCLEQTLVPFVIRKCFPSSLLMA